MKAFPKTTPNRLFPGTGTLCRFGGEWHRWWPSYMTKARLLLIHPPNLEASYPRRLSYPRLNRRAPRPQQSEDRLTAELLSGIQGLPPEACPCLRNRRRDYSAETNHWGRKEALSCLLRSSAGNPAGQSKPLIRCTPR